MTAYADEPMVADRPRMTERALASLRRGYAVHRFSKNFIVHYGLMLPLYVDRGFGYDLMALFNLIYWLTFTLSQLPAGVFADRAGARAPLIVGPCLTAFGYLMFGAGTASWQMIVAAAATGVGQSLCYGPEVVLVKQALQDGRRGVELREIESTGWVMRNLSLLSAVLVGFALLLFFNVGVAFYLSAAVVLVAVIFPLRLATPAAARDGLPAPETPRLRATAGEAWRLRWPIAAFVWFYVWDAVGLVVAQLWLVAMGVQPYQISLVMLVPISCAAATYLFRRRIGRLMQVTDISLTLLVLLQYAVIAATAMFSHAMTVGGLIAALALLGIVRSEYYPLARARVANAAPDRMTGTMLSIASVVGTASVTVSAPLVIAVSGRATLLGCTLALLTIGLAGFAVLKLRRPEPEKGG